MAGTLLLASCSLELDPDPTPTAAPTAVVFGPNDIVVDTLLDDSLAAWKSVTGWTSETSIDSPQGGSASGASTRIAEEMILPGDRHLLSMNGETVVTEEIVADGTLYMRGTLVSSSIYPAVDADTWITFTPDQVPPGTVLEQRVSYLLSAPEFPFASVTDETRALPARPAGEIQVDGRACLVFAFTTASADSAGINYRIAFDEQDRPCQLVREAGGVIETTSWSYPERQEPITAPADATRVDAFPGGSG
jgi:hypothetical protein